MKYTQYNEHGRVGMGDYLMSRARAFCHRSVLNWPIETTRATEKERDREPEKSTTYQLNIAKKAELYIANK